MLWWRPRRAPSVGSSFYTGASLQRSRPVPQPVVLHVLALLSWRCRQSRWFSLLSGRYRGFLVHSELPQNPGQPLLRLLLAAQSLCLCGRRFLTRQRYPSQCSRPVVSPAGRRPVAPQAFYRRVALRSSKAPLSFSNLKYFKKFQITQNTTIIANRCPIEL